MAGKEESAAGSISRQRVNWNIDIGHRTDGRASEYVRPDAVPCLYDERSTRTVVSHGRTTRP